MRLKPRNPVARAPILRKGGPHTTTRKAERRQNKVALERAVRRA